MSKFSVKKPYTVLVGVVLAIVLGVVAFTRMTADLLPNINLPYVLVMTTYAGASPETVETVVTSPIESAMATVSNIEEIQSVSSENYSMVILQFAQSANMDSISLEIRENLDQIKSYWDDSVGNPIIMKLNPDMLPIMIAAVGLEGSDQAQVSDYVNNTVIPALESIEGVASASATGLLEESVNVIISEDKIDAMNEKVYAAIDKKMAEAEEELANGRKELEDGKAELDKGKKELIKGQKEINNGQAELDKGKEDLEKGKQELTNKQNELTSQLAKQKNQLLTTKMSLTSMQNDLTQAKTLNDSMAQLKPVVDGLTALGSNNMAVYTDIMTRAATATATLSAVPPTDPLYMAAMAELATVASDMDALKAKITENTALVSVLATQPDLQALFPLDALKAMDWKDPANATAVGTAIGTADAMVSQSLPAMQKQYNDLDNALIALTKGMGYTGYANMVQTTVLGELNKTLPEGSKVSDLAAAIAYIDAALVQIEQGELTAAIEFANGQTQIALGQYQMQTAQSQLDEGKKKIEDGLSQLESAREQLADGEEKLLDGEKQLADAKENAYDQANMEKILTVDTVKGLLTAQNFSMPAGYVTEEGVSYLIRVGDKPDSIDALKALPLLDLHMEDVPVITLDDVADVFFTDNSKSIYTNVNGNPGVMISMQKQTGYSTGDVSDKLKAKFESMMEKEQGLHIITLMDQGIYIDLVMDSIINNILLGALLAIIILLLFLKDIRPTAVVAFSIPVSLVVAVVCMYFTGVTLNVISLSGLALGIGMLVDNSIVVIENIYRMRNEGKSILDASVEGAKEVAGAIFASTLTTVCVFLPIVFTEGITRQLFVDLGLTIGYSLMASLLIALTVVPAMASKMMKSAKPKAEGKFMGALSRGYAAVLRGALKVKVLVFVIVIALLGGSAALALTNGTAFMTQMDSPQLTVNVSLGKEAKLEETAEVTNQVVEILLSMEDVVEVGAMTSSSGRSMFGAGGNTSTNRTSVYVVTTEDKKLSNEEMARQIMELTADLPANISVDTSTMDMSALGGSGISIQVQGRDLDTLAQTAADVAMVLGEVEGTENVKDGLGDSEEEMRVYVDREKAAGYGLTVAQVFQQIMPKIASAKSSTTLVAPAKDYGVFVSSEKDAALTRETLKEILISGTDENKAPVEIPLSEIATFEAAKSLTSINRTGQTRYVTVSASIADGYNVGLVANEVNKRFEHYKVPEGVKLVFKGENETINEALGQVMLMLVLALVFMYLIMVAQFQSLLSPFIIMFTIPLAFTGGLLGLYVSGSEISVIALIGFVMLSGIIVNNGIVLIDYMNQLIAEGMEKKEAILLAGKTRLRPVLMTALTTILALSTMVFSQDMGADMAKPMAIVTIGGLLYGTLLTLIVIPCIYDVFIRNKKDQAILEEVIDK